MIDTKSFRIAIVGAGLMGHGIAQEFAQHGFQITIFEKDPERRNSVLSQIESNLALLLDEGIVTASEFPKILSRIRVSDSLESAVNQAQFVIEAVFENLELKRSIFKRLDELCPKSVILASNSSSFTPSQYAKGTSSPERILGTHYFNPPYLVPLVEVIKGRETSEKTMKSVVSILEDIGKKIAVVRKESPGFIANRIQIALFREAFNVVEQGIATPEEVDLAIKNSFGRRLGIMGPFEQCDIIGADLKLAIYNALVPHISHSQKPSLLLVRKVNEGSLGMKTGQGFYKWTHAAIQIMNRKLRQWLVSVNRLEKSLETLSVENGEPKNESDKG